MAQLFARPSDNNNVPPEVFARLQARVAGAMICSSLGPPLSGAPGKCDCLAIITSPSANDSPVPLE
eukprot:9291482-Pyramimonas_sp.AAC.1